MVQLGSSGQSRARRKTQHMYLEGDVMALLIGISRGKNVQIGDYSLAFLGREKEDDRRFLFRLSRPDEQATDLAIAKEEPVCLFGEVTIMVVAGSQYSRDAMVRLRSEADKKTQITRPVDN